MKKIYLIDVSAMFFRAFYAIRPLTSPQGVPVNATYGFLAMLVKLFKEERPEYLVFCYDRKEPSFRKEMYDDYKANRSEMPEDLAVQIPYIKRIAEILGIPSLEVPSYEADDIIGTLTKKRNLWDAEIVIVSGDKDFSQLIEPGVVLFDTMKDVKYDTDGVIQKWGVAPDRFIDYLAIVGDSSDNIPGVKGIGEKGALKLLEQFPNLEAIYEGLEKVESKSIKQKLIDSKELALLSKKLVTIACDVPLSEKIEDYHLRQIKQDELREFLKELNFKNFEKVFLGEVANANGTLSQMPHAPSEGGQSKNGSVSTKGSTGSKALPEAVGFLSPLQELPAYERIVLTEENLIQYFKKTDEVCAFQSEDKYYLAKGMQIFEYPQELQGQLLNPLELKWKGHDLKSLWHHFHIDEPQLTFDTMVASYVLKVRDASDFAKVYGQEMQAEVPEIQTPEWIYHSILQLEEFLKQKLRDAQVTVVYEKFDHPLVRILYKMEKKGIALDSALLANQSQLLGQDLEVLEKQIHQLAGEEFNIASPKQLGQILFEKLGLAAGKKTKTGYSTDNEVLQSLGHPIAPLVLEYRELAKLKSTYVDSLPNLVHPDGRIHTHLNQALTTTGRLSSNNPNLQNIPIRTLRGQEVRKAFIAEGNQLLLSADYSQIELRVLAHISEDPNLCKAFAEDFDIHSATAAEVFGIALKDVTPELRRTAKAINFGIAYGQGAFGLAENLGIGRTEAKSIIDRYFVRFKNVQEYIESTIKKAHSQGYVETLFGRKRYIDELSAKNPALKKFGERAAINAPIQGTAADLVKLAMIELDQKIKIPMLLQVHDELIFEGEEADLKAASTEIVKIMEGVVKLKVPLKVNFAIGKNWDTAH